MIDDFVIFILGVTLKRFPNDSKEIGVAICGKLTELRIGSVKNVLVEKQAECKTLMNNVTESWCYLLFVFIILFFI